MNDIEISRAELVRVQKQEEELVFGSFTNEDALKLGLTIIDVAKERGVNMAMTIEVNGAEYFSYLMPGTSAENRNWMRRKINFVNLTGHSSYYNHHSLIVRGKTLQDLGLSEADYAAVGGSFPIIMPGGVTVGSVTVSGLPHQEDHRLVTDAIARYLGK